MSWTKLNCAHERVLTCPSFTRLPHHEGDAKSHVKFTFDGNEDSSGVVSKAFAVNKDLEADEWMQAIQWASESEQETAVAGGVFECCSLSTFQRPVCCFPSQFH